jgi:ribonucleoside-diphosphate reductase alpha chain
MFKSELAYENWKSKYRYDQEDPLGTFKRVAYALASVEKNPKEWEDKFLRTLVKFSAEDIPIGLKCTTGGRITANIGTSYKHATLLNCFSGDTEYLDVNAGVVKFKEMCGKDTLVLTKNGFIESKVECFGVQKTFDFIFKPAYYSTEFIDKKGRITNTPDAESTKRGIYRVSPRSSYSITVTSTQDHRWILSDGQETTNLKIGDIVEANTYCSEESNEQYKKGKIHGLIFGDGSVSYVYTDKPNSSGRYGLTRYYIRLCGKKSVNTKYFNSEDIQYSPSHMGEPTCYYTTDVDLKNIPKYENIDYIRGFIDGWVATDGCYIHGDTKKINEISTTDLPAADWLKKHAFIAGYLVTGYREDSNVETNYGIRKNKVVRVILSKEVVKWKTVGILENVEQEVFCAVVPNEKSFTLSNGLYTGNCFISGPVSGATIKYHRQSEDESVGYDVEYTSVKSPDDLTNIFLTILEQAKTLATEGGYGINFSFIRPRGSIIKGIGIRHPGVMAYMDVFDEVSNCIVRGTNDGYIDRIKNYLSTDEFNEAGEKVKAMARKGAMMAVLDCSHPDIEEFIRAKQEPDRLTKFNVSVLISDELLIAVEKDEFFDLIFDNKVYKRIKARDLYNLIMESTYNRNEPGVLFEGNMNRNNPISYLGRLKCTNPCLHGDSMLLTKNGLSPIEDLEGTETVIWNGSAWSKSSIFCSGVKPIYKVHISNGMSIKGTLDHRVDCNGEETQLKDTLGKEITRMSGVDWEGKETSLTNFELLCLGFTFGDGSYHKASKRYKYVYIGDKDSDVENIFNSIGEELGCEHRYDKRKLSVNFAKKCKLLNFPELNLPDRFLSKEILELPPRQLKTFLRGLFSANGSVQPKHARISIKLTSSELLHQLQVILMAFDIKSYVTTNKEKDVTFENGVYTCRESYDLNITSSDVLNFRDEIGFVQGYKVNLLNEINKNFGRRLKSVVTSIEYIGEEKVYDFTEPETHWGFVNGLKVHNCGEIGGIASLTTVCLLGSLNLTQYVYIGEDGKAYFDWDLYTDDIKTFTRMLDNVNDLSYISLPSYQWATDNLRQFGMGVNGLGSALMMLGIPYNSQEGVNFTKRICQVKENLTWQASALLAEEKGTFKGYIKEKFESTEYFNSDRITEETRNLLRKHGVRNAKTTTNPPLGNSSVITGTSNGIEPLFNLEYERTVICKEWPSGLNQDNVKAHLKSYRGKDQEYWRGLYNGKTYYYEPKNRGLCEISIVRDYGYQWLLDNFPNTNHSAYLTTAKNIDVDDHLNIQEVVQHYNNQSVSKTCNLPNEYPFEKFKDLYYNAWKRGLNGFTTYREGTMESVLSNISKTEGTKGIVPKDIQLPNKFTNGPTKIIKRQGHKFYIHFSYLPEDTNLDFPIVMWIYTNERYKGEELKICHQAARNLGKLALSKGVDETIVMNTLDKAKLDYPHNRLGRMVSLNLRHNVPREDILSALMGLDGDNISTLVTAVRKFLSETLPDGTRLKGAMCDNPDCTGSRHNVVLESGCKKCLDCGTSSCGA